MELLGQNKVDHHQRKVAIISQDSFYKVLTPDQKAKALKGQYNFDHPGACSLQWCLDVDVQPIVLLLDMYISTRNVPVWLQNVQVGSC